MTRLVGLSGPLNAATAAVELRGRSGLNDTKAITPNQLRKTVRIHVLGLLPLSLSGNILYRPPVQTVVWGHANLKRTLMLLVRQDIVVLCSSIIHAYRPTGKSCWNSYLQLSKHDYTSRNGGYWSRIHDRASILPRRGITCRHTYRISYGRPCPGLLIRVKRRARYRPL